MTASATLRFWLPTTSWPLQEGVFGEPASAASVAGLIKHARRLDLSGKRVVCVITGSGLKDPDNAMKDAPAIVELPADLAQVAKALGLT